MKAKIVMGHLGFSLYGGCQIMKGDSRHISADLALSQVLSI